MQLTCKQPALLTSADRGTNRSSPSPTLSASGSRGSSKRADLPVGGEIRLEALGESVAKGFQRGVVDGGVYISTQRLPKRNPFAHIVKYGTSICMYIRARPSKCQA